MSIHILSWKTCLLDSTCCFTLGLKIRIHSMENSLHVHVTLGIDVHVVNLFHDDFKLMVVSV